MFSSVQRQEPKWIHISSQRHTRRIEDHMGIRSTGRSTDIQMQPERQKNRQSDTQIDRHTVRQIDKIAYCHASINISLQTYLFMFSKPISALLCYFPSFLNILPLSAHNYCHPKFLWPHGSRSLMTWSIWHHCNHRTKKSMAAISQSYKTLFGWPDRIVACTD